MVFWWTDSWIIRKFLVPFNYLIPWQFSHYPLPYESLISSTVERSSLVADVISCDDIISIPSRIWRSWWLSSVTWSSGARALFSERLPGAPLERDCEWRETLSCVKFETRSNFDDQIRSSLRLRNLKLVACLWTPEKSTIPVRFEVSQRKQSRKQLSSMDAAPIEPPPYTQNDPIVRSSGRSKQWEEVTPYITPENITPKTRDVLRHWPNIQRRNGVILSNPPTVRHLYCSRVLWEIKLYFSDGKSPCDWLSDGTKASFGMPTTTYSWSTCVIRWSLGMQ